jgi:hypothetical protein
MASEEGQDNQSDISSSDSSGNDSPDVESNQPDSESVEEPIPPAGLSFVEQIIWKKKWKEHNRRLVQNTSIPSVAVYVPSAAKEKLGKD